MMGKTHKVIGLATGVAIALYGYFANDPLFMLALVTTPTGAMLPDIDHKHTKLGRTRKMAFRALKKVLPVIVGILLGAYVTVGYMEDLLIEYILIASVLMVPLALCILVSKSSTIKKKFKFFKKHRGIMHTLIVPIVLVVGVTFISYRPFAILLGGFAAGYVSHLAADCLTVSGCPILWPLTEKSVRIMKIKTQTAAEYIAAVILSGGVIWIGYWLGNYY